MTPDLFNELPTLSSDIGLAIFAVLFGLVCLLTLKRSTATQIPHPDIGQGILPILSDGCVFLFNGQQLVRASDDALRLLEDLGPGTAKSPWEALIGAYRNSCPTIARNLSELAKSGRRFSQDVELNGCAALRIEGVPRGQHSAVFIRDLSEERLALVRCEERCKAAEEDLGQLRKVLESAPVMAWQRDVAGQIEWSNAKARDIFSAFGEFHGKLPEPFLARSHGASDTRVGLEDSDGVRRWFNVLESEAVADGVLTGIATDVTVAVQAERALSRFVGTMTETFAHLPTALVVFDADRRLKLFNPAVGDHLSLDPAWLARKPSFRVFMDALRERSLVPEQVDREKWLEFVQSLLERTVDGTLVDKWHLPSGQILQISGRPHPYDSIALIFEDITSREVMEQKYRAEIEMSEATLNRLSESVAVFNTAGALVYNNSAFVSLWGFDPMAKLEAPGIAEVTRVLGGYTEATPTWGDLRDFVTGPDDRAEWSAEVTLLDGRVFAATFAPMPDGSTLTVFEDITRETELERRDIGRRRAADARAEQAQLLSVLHRDDLVETLNTVRDALEDADQPALKTLIDDALRRESAINRVRATEHPTARPQPTAAAALHDLAHRSGLSLDLSFGGDSTVEAPPPEVYRVLFNTVLAATEVARPGADLDLSVVGIDDGIAISCMFPTESPQSVPDFERRSLPYRLLNRYVRNSEGRVTLSTLEDGKSIKIDVVLPRHAVPLVLKNGSKLQATG